MSRNTKVIRPFATNVVSSKNTTSPLHHDDWRLCVPDTGLVRPHGRRKRLGWTGILEPNLSQRPLMYKTSREELLQSSYFYVFLEEGRDPT